MYIKLTNLKCRLNNKNVGNETVQRWGANLYKLKNDETNVENARKQREIPNTFLKGQKKKHEPRLRWMNCSRKKLIIYTPED